MVLSWQSAANYERRHPGLSTIQGGGSGVRRLLFLSLVMVPPIAVSLTSEAYAASSAALESPAGVIETAHAAELMGVSTQQADADLALQHDALGYVQALQQGTCGGMTPYIHD
jgi:hypothetical protein